MFMYKFIAIISFLLISTPSMGSPDDEDLIQWLAAAKKLISQCRMHCVKRQSMLLEIKM